VNDLTKPQRDMLELLAAARTPLNAKNLLHHLGEHHETTQGATQTAASLVRRGYAKKMRMLGGVVHYSPTPRGVELLAALASLEGQVTR
jgi:Fe2+ or Zn2+ uptake regulation protein